MSAIRKFADSRETVLHDERLGLDRNPEVSAAMRREIALFRALTDGESRALEEGRDLPSRERIEDLSSNLKLTVEHCKSLLRGAAAITGPGLPSRGNENIDKTGLREFVVDLRRAQTYDEFVTAFNVGFCIPNSGRWEGNNWNAFHDYLGWPTEDRFKLRFKGYDGCPGLNPQERDMINEILADNPHVIVELD